MMNKSKTDILMPELNHFITANMGLYYTEDRWDDLERKVGIAAHELHFRDTESYINYLLSPQADTRDIKTLATFLTIGETYFFRDKDVFDILEKHVIPELINSGRWKSLRIWSAACSTGEEAYSIAILLDQMLSGLKDINVTIMGTDINTLFLQKATKGIYKKWSFRDVVPISIKEKYFRADSKGNYEIISRIKEKVKFFNLNLIKDVYPSFVNNTNTMNVIFCRNVFMYFDDAGRRSVIKNLYNSLADGGYLFTSPCEAISDYFSSFETVYIKDTILHKKESKKYEKDKTVLLNAYDDINRIRRRPAIDSWQSPIIEHKELEAFRNLFDEASDLYEGGFYAEVTEKITKLLAGEKDNTEAIILLARACANQGDLAEALRWCKRAIDLNKTEPCYHYLLATLFQERAMFNEAVESLKKAIYLDTDFVIAHFAMGNLMCRLGNTGEADMYFKNALAILDTVQQEEIVPESEGMTAGRIKEIIQSIIQAEKL